jgi:hypothetical protein
VVTAPLMYLFFNNSSPTPDQKFFEKYFPIPMIFYICLCFVICLVWRFL